MMRFRHVARLIVICVSFFSGLLFANQVKFLEPVNFFDEYGDSINRYVKEPSPSIVDWDGDGVKDLLVGEGIFGKLYGPVTFMKNNGTNEEPKYDSTIIFLEADGKLIRNANV